MRKSLGIILMSKMKSLSTKEIQSRMMTKFGHRETNGAHLCILEVPDGTGSNKIRTADAISMSLWPSRGLSISGYEIKASRSDWVKELKNPAKAEWFWKRCDYWSLVVGDPSIVKEGELPSTWGLMVPYGKGLKWAVQPTRLDPEQVTMNFLAGMLRAAVHHVPKSETEIRKRERESFQLGVKHGENSRDHISENNRKRCEELENRIKEFEEHTGISISSRWKNDTKPFSRVVKALDGIDLKIDRLDKLIQSIQEVKTYLPDFKNLLGEIDEN